MMVWLLTLLTSPSVNYIGVLYDCNQNPANESDIQKLILSQNYNPLMCWWCLSHRQWTIDVVGFSPFLLNKWWSHKNILLPSIHLFQVLHISIEYNVLWSFSVHIWSLLYLDCDKKCHKLFVSHNSKSSFFVGFLCDLCTFRQLKRMCGFESRKKEWKLSMKVSTIYAAYGISGENVWNHISCHWLCRLCKIEWKKSFPSTKISYKMELIFILASQWQSADEFHPTE